MTNKIASWGGRQVSVGTSDDGYVMVNVEDSGHPDIDMLFTPDDARRIASQLRVQATCAEGRAPELTDERSEMRRELHRLRQALSDCGLPESIINRLEEGAP